MSSQPSLSWSYLMQHACSIADRQWVSHFACCPDPACQVPTNSAGTAINQVGQEAHTPHGLSQPQLQTP